MPKYVVASIDFLENEIHLEIITANTWQEAWVAHSKSLWDKDDTTLEGLSLEEAKEICFNSDCMMNHIEI